MKNYYTLIFIVPMLWASPRGRLLVAMQEFERASDHETYAFFKLSNVLTKQDQRRSGELAYLADQKMSFQRNLWRYLLGLPLTPPQNIKRSTSCPLF